MTQLRVMCGAVLPYYRDHLSYTCAVQKACIVRIYMRVVYVMRTEIFSFETTMKRDEGDIMINEKC